MAPPLLSVALLASVLGIGACGGAAGPGAHSQAGGSGGDGARVAVSESRVALHVNGSSHTVRRARARLAGTVTRGSKVSVDGRRAGVRGGHWHRSVHLHLGRNAISVRATHPGDRTARRTVQITRRRSAAEVRHRRLLREAAAERRAARRAQRRAAREARQAEERAAREAQRQAESPPSAPAAGAGPAETCTNGTYVNAQGNTVCRPEESPTAPAGATAECEDGTYSFSESRSGTCSHHGGVKRWL